MSKRIVDRADFKVDSNKEELLALLEQIAEGVLTEWGLTVERYAKEKCPVDTGRLRNSITWALGGKRSVYVGTNVKYAQYVELGTSRMSPRPYLKPAVTDHISEYMDILKEHLDAAKEP